MGLGINIWWNNWVAAIKKTKFLFTPTSKLEMTEKHIPMKKSDS